MASQYGAKTLLGECRYCGLRPQAGHPNPVQWLKKHEKNCPARPKNDTGQNFDNT